MSLFQSGTIYLQKTNFDELFFKLYLIRFSIKKAKSVTKVLFYFPLIPLTFGEDRGEVSSPSLLFASKQKKFLLF